MSYVGPLMDPLGAIDQAFGLWAKRSDLPATHRYVRTLRKDTRWRRLGIATSKDRPR